MMIHYPAIFNPTQTEISAITSEFVHQDYQLFISLPAGYNESDKTFPVLYLLDGNGIFPLVKPMVEFLQLTRNVPDLIIVGIGYPTNTYWDTAGLRGRDLTHIELTPERKATLSYPFEETGGASRFFAFITQELIPYIDHEFRADPNDRTLAGFSLGGNFALYALFQEPALFRRLISISPALSIEGVSELEEHYAKTHTALPIKFYFASEMPTDDTIARDRVSQFVKVMGERGYTGLTSKLHILDDLDHVSAGPIGLAFALREIFQ